MTTAAPVTSSTVDRPPWLSASAAVVGVLAIAGAIYQVSTDGPPEFALDTWGDWFRELGFLSYLLASVVAVTGARRMGLLTSTPSWLIRIGYSLVAAGVLAGVVMGEDPDWFFVVGGPGNLLAIIGFIWWGIVAIRGRRMPLWACLLCGFGGTTAVLFGEFGTGVLIGSFWLWVAAASPKGRV